MKEEAVAGTYHGLQNIQSQPPCLSIFVIDWKSNLLTSLAFFGAQGGPMTQNFWWVRHKWKTMGYFGLLTKTYPSLEPFFLTWTRTCCLRPSRESICGSGVSSLKQSPKQTFKETPLSFENLSKFFSCSFVIDLMFAPYLTSTTLKKSPC